MDVDFVGFQSAELLYLNALAQGDVLFAPELVHCVWLKSILYFCVEAIPRSSYSRLLVNHRFQSYPPSPIRQSTGRCDSAISPLLIQCCLQRERIHLPYPSNSMKESGHALIVVVQSDRPPSVPSCFCHHQALVLVSRVSLNRCQRRSPCFPPIHSMRLVQRSKTSVVVVDMGQEQPNR